MFAPMTTGDIDAIFRQWIIGKAKRDHLEDGSRMPVDYFQAGYRAAERKIRQELKLNSGK